jgi:nitroreductase
MIHLPPPPQENDPLPAPAPDEALGRFLALRRSTKVAHLVEPGPDPATVDAIIRLGARVPDHGKLSPWRFIVLEGGARAAKGAALAALVAARRPGCDPALLELERTRFERAPVVVIVVSTAAPHPKIPNWEQELSAGAACFGILLAARAFGFGGCWLSEWPAYDADAAAALGLVEGERAAGFLYLGTAREPPTERARPDVATRITRPAA